MNRNNILLFFAVFAATIMLMATCVAGPIREDAQYDSNNGNQDLFDAMTSIYNENMENDEQLELLNQALKDDRELQRIQYDLENTRDMQQKAILTSKYFNTLKEKPEYNQLIEHIKTNYKSEIENNLREIADNTEMNPDSDIYNEENGYSIDGALPLYGALFTVGNPTEVTSSSNPEGTIDSLYGSDWHNDLFSGEGDGSEYDGIDDPIQDKFAGFLRNQEGDQMLIPGFGWVSPEDYAWFEDMLKELPVNAALTLIDWYINEPDSLGGLLALLAIIYFFIELINAVLDALDIGSIEELVYNILVGIYIGGLLVIQIIGTVIFGIVALIGSVIYGYFLAIMWLCFLIFEALEELFPSIMGAIRDWLIGILYPTA